MRQTTVHLDLSSRFFSLFAGGIGARKRLSFLGLCLTALALVGQPDGLYAQEQVPSDSLYRVETTDGQVVFGTLISENEEEVVLDTQQLGQVTLQRSDIRRMKAIDPDNFRDGEYWHPNPQPTRYLFAPNAIGLREGQGYYQNTWILLNNVNYGVTNSFSMGVGTVPVFLFGANALPIWVLPKVSFATPLDNLHLAGGAVFGGVLAGEGGGTAGLLYGSSTLGSREHNLTLGLAYGYTGEGFSDTPAVNISGMTRLGRTTYLITENYIFPEVEAAILISLGFRWAPENFAVDFALVRPLPETGEGLIALPWLGVTIPFGS